LKFQKNIFKIVSQINHCYIEKKTAIHIKDEFQKKIIRKGTFGDWENEFSDDEKCIFKKNIASPFYNF
jgi:hypothetical protein